MKNKKNKLLAILFTASIVNMQASDLAFHQMPDNQPVVHQYADENFLVEIGVTREVAKIVARDVTRALADVVTEFVVRPWNPVAADISKAVCLEANSADHSAAFIVDSSCDICSNITKWWRN